MASDERTGAQAIEAQHGELQGCLDRIREAEDEQALAALLDDLIPWMEDHFAREEGPDGLVAIAETSSLHHYEVARRIVREHPALLEAARRLRDTPRHEEALRLVDQMRDHERRESELLVEMVYEDLGIGD